MMLTSLENSFSAQIDIYRWVDKNNIVHFSQELPQAGSYLELTTISSYESLSKEARQEKALREELELRIQAQADEQQTTTEVNAITFKQNCIAAKQNIKMLTSFDEVLVTELKSDGNKVERVLNEKEKQDKLILSNKHVALYCKPQ
jgi:hypothetical protein